MEYLERPILASFAYTSIRKRFTSHQLKKNSGLDMIRVGHDRPIVIKILNSILNFKIKQKSSIIKDSLKYDNL